MTNKMDLFEPGMDRTEIFRGDSCLNRSHILVRDNKGFFNYYLFIGLIKVQKYSALRLSSLFFIKVYSKMNSFNLVTSNRISLEANP